MGRKDNNQARNPCNIFSLKQEYDTMDLDEVLNILHMKKRIQQAKALHPYEIHYTEKSGYFTDVDDDTAPTGKKKIRKCSEERLWDALAEWYLDNSDRNLTLEQVYEKWLDWKTTPNNVENIKRIQTAWKTYYLDELMSKPLLEKPIAKITTLDLRTWAESLMKKHLPDKKKFSRMFTIINQCFEYASDEDIALV